MHTQTRDLFCKTVVTSTPCDKSNTTLGPKFYCHSVKAVTRRSEVVQQHPLGILNRSTIAIDLARFTSRRINFQTNKEWLCLPEVVVNRNVATDGRMVEEDDDNQADGR